MALENFCDKIIGIEDFAEVKERLSEFDVGLLQSRDEHGNSLLHLVVENDCHVSVFRAVLSVSDISVRNDEFKLAQDLFQDRVYEEEYVNEIVGFIADKLRDADGIFIRDLISNGWDHVPYLKLAIESVVDIMNDNFFDYLASVEELIDNVKMMTYEVVNGDCDDINLTENFRIEQVLSMRNHCGLTMVHVATIFERYNLVMNIVNKYEDIALCNGDHMGRNILHYLYAMPISDQREQLIGNLASKECFNVVDIIGNYPQFYEYTPDQVGIDACKHWIRAELLDVKNTTVTVEENTGARVTSGDDDLDSNYLKKKVGKVLINALAILVEKRPLDPIEFLGCYLKFCESGLDDDKYEFETLSSGKMSQLCQEFVTKSFTFGVEVFSPFCKVARDKNGTPIGYKILLKKLQSLDKATTIDWFDLMRRGMNFALRDSRGKTLLDLAAEQDLPDAADCLDMVVLNMINEDNLGALRHLVSLGFYDHLPDMYDLCGPDLFGVSEQMADFYGRLTLVNDLLQRLFSGEQTDDDLRPWSEVIDCEMIAYAYNDHGLSLIHAAIVHDQRGLFDYLADQYPLSLRLKDCFNRNVAHYAVAYEREQMLIDTIDRLYPDAKTEMDCFDYLPEYYEFYKNEFRRLI